MYIAEQNMVGAALGLATRGKIPFVSTFAAFFSRAFDQIRMSQYSGPNIKFVGSHAGVSIGEDGPSQMGLEDLAMFRAILDSVVLYPADAVSTEKLVESGRTRRDRLHTHDPHGHPHYLRPRGKIPPRRLREVLHQSDNDLVTVIGAGVTPTLFHGSPNRLNHHGRLGLPPIMKVFVGAGLKPAPTGGYSR